VDVLSGSQRVRKAAAHAPRVMKVLVLAPYPLNRAPSQRFRWEQYIQPLGVHDILIAPSCLLDVGDMDLIHAPRAWSAKLALLLRGIRRRLRDVRAARNYDLVLVHRESFPVGPAWVERLLQTMRVPYVIDFDDAIFLPAASEANRRLAWLKGAGKTKRVVAGASLVIAGNGHLAGWARQYARRVTVIPTTVDTERYQVRERPVSDRVCVGWSGSPTTIAHLTLLEPVLARLQREEGIRIRVIGDASYRIDGVELDSLDWRAASELRDLSEIDIGVMPMPDDEWSRGKCGLKALQYMALGIPAVISPVGVNREIAHGGAAILASTQDEWLAALRALIGDPELRSRVGAAGRARVQERYSVASAAALWEQALREAAGMSGPAAPPVNSIKEEVLR
jgi:glycosyltransferase involved in cell wall biosynthesis